MEKKDAMEEDLHFVGNHEAEAALFFGTTSLGVYRARGGWRKKSYEGESALC